MRPPKAEDDPEERARAAVPEMVAALDLPRRGWLVRRLTRRVDPNLVRAVVRCDHWRHDPLVVKAQVKPADPAAFARGLARHTEAHARFPHDTRLAMPRLVWSDGAALTCAFPFIRGAAGVAHLRALAGARQAALRQLGAWFAALHHAGGVEEVDFHPRAAVSRWRKLAEGVRAGEARVAERPVFLGAVAALRRRARAMAEAGRPPALSVLPHGDAHLANFVWDRSGCLWGFDLYPRGRSNAAQDIAKLLMDVVTVVHDPAELDPGDPVPPATRAAFLEGYGLIAPDDPVLDFFCRAELVRILAGVPANPAARSRGKARTLARVLPVIARVFGDG